MQKHDRCALPAFDIDQVDFNLCIFNGDKSHSAILARYTCDKNF